MVTRLVADMATLGDRLVAECQAEATRAMSARGRFTLALSGGSVATTFFPRLARLAVDWAKTDFFWADERAVAPDDPESNYAVAKSLWLDPAHVPPSSVHRMVAEAPDAAASVREYAAALVRAAGIPPVLDLVLLGMGPDGHVASLFPGHPLLGETHATVAAVTDSPKPPPRRMTLTLPVLTAASFVVVAASGAAKADVVRQALTESASPLPVARVARGARRVLFLLDPDAASRL